MHNNHTLHLLIHLWTRKPWEKIFIFWPWHPWQDIAEKIQANLDGIFIIIGYDQPPKEEYPALDQWLQDHSVVSDVFLLNEDLLHPLDITKNLKCIIPLNMCHDTLSNISTLHDVRYKIEKDFVIDSCNPNSARWLCLNRRLSAHRKYAKTQWIDRYPGSFVHSFGEEQFFGDINFYNSVEDLPSYSANAINLFTLAPLYSTTCGSIVMETCTFTPVTEKVFHAFLALHPIIIVGNTGTVEYLRNQGFDMFDDLIDHSYDKITDINARIDRLFSDNINIIVNGVNRQSMYTRLCQNRDRVWSYYQNQVKNFEINLLKNLKHV